MTMANSTTRAARWLSLGAAPTFALMAVLTGVIDHGAPEMLCSAMSQTSALSGMVPMYVLMSVFHVAPWLKLIAGWRSGVAQLSAAASTGRRVRGVRPTPMRRLTSAAIMHNPPAPMNAAL